MAHTAHRWRFEANLQEWSLCSPCVLWVSTEPRLSGVAAITLTSPFLSYRGSGLSRLSIPSAKSPTFVLVTAQGMKGTQGFFCLPNRHSGLQAGSLGRGQLCTHTSCLLVLPWKGEEKPCCCPEPADRWVQQEEATFWLAEGWLFIIMLDPLHPAPGSQSPPEFPFPARCRVF